MKAAIITKHKGTLEIIEVPIPQPQRDEVLVQILACGCCHTDVHAIDGDWGNLQSKLPLCPGPLKQFLTFMKSNDYFVFRS